MINAITARSTNINIIHNILFVIKEATVAMRLKASIAIRPNP